MSGKSCDLYADDSLGRDLLLSTNATRCTCCHNTGDRSWVFLARMVTRGTRFIHLLVSSELNDLSDNSIPTLFLGLPCERSSAVTRDKFRGWPLDLGFHNKISERD